MASERTNNADKRPGESKSMAHGLEELRTVLGDLAGEALSDEKEVMQLIREDFQSTTYQQAGYGNMPERYGTSDRYVYTLEYADGSQVIIMGGKFASGRHYASGAVVDPLADNRESANFIYKYDGEKTVIERLPGGEVNRITGTLGRPGGLLPLLREWAGKSVHTERFAKDQQ
jgi:hypothetical protein